MLLRAYQSETLHVNRLTFCHPLVLVSERCRNWEYKTQRFVQCYFKTKVSARFSQWIEALFHVFFQQCNGVSESYGATQVLDGRFISFDNINVAEHW